MPKKARVLLRSTWDKVVVLCIQNAADGNQAFILNIQAVDVLGI